LIELLNTTRQQNFLFLAAIDKSGHVIGAT
jgi:hypothetical protein